MSDRLTSNEIIKLLRNLIGPVEAVGETNADIVRLNNLKTLIDVTDWCLDGIQFASDSARGRWETSMQEIGKTAIDTLCNYAEWLNEFTAEER